MQGAILNVNGIITDLDRLQFTAWQQVAMYEYGMGLPGKLAPAFKGMPATAALAKFLEHFHEVGTDKAKQELLKEQDHFYEQALTELKPADLIPGAKRLIIVLYDHYVKLAINEPAGHAATISKQLGLDEFLDETPTPSSKQPYTHLVESLAVPASGCIALVTGAADLQAANQSHMVTIGVGDPAELAGADYQVRQVGDLRYQMLEKVWEDTHENK